MENLRTGYRFYPTEEELVHFYLRNKVEGCSEDLNQTMTRIIPTMDIYDFSPRDLPLQSGEVCHGDPEQWFFFVPMQESEVRGGRPKRLTTSGYWKATGSPGWVYSSINNRAIGAKRTMVFYEGRAPNGTKTDWKMNEYKLIQGEASLNSPPQLRHEYCLCRVYKKSKCLRAFDRRPALDAGARFSDHRQDHNRPSQSTGVPPLMAAAMTTSGGSPEGSTSTSSGDVDGQPSDNQSQARSGERQRSSSGDGMEVLPDNQAPLWDWENWFFK